MSNQWTKGAQYPLNLTAKPVKKFAKEMRDRVNLEKDDKSGRNSSHSVSM